MVTVTVMVTVMAMAMDRVHRVGRSHSFATIACTYRRYGCLSILVLFTGTACAAKWTLVPTLGVEETYTDNLRLGPPGSQRGDWVTQVRPGLSVNATGARLRLDASYALQALHRANDGSDDLLHSLDARATAELSRQLFYLDATASIAQQNVSLLGPQAASNINVTGNRATVNSYSLSPYLHRELGSQAVVDARFTHSSVSSNASSSSSPAAAAGIKSDSERIDLKATSGPAYRLMRWNAAYSAERTGNGQADTRTERVLVGARRLVTPAFGIQLNAGYDRNNYLSSGQAPKGLSWNVGPEWTPTPRTRVAATIGRRYNGSDRALDFSHRTRLSAWTATYSEDITTARQQTLVPRAVETAAYLNTLFLSSIPDAAARQAAVQDFMTRTNLPPTLEVPLNFLTTVPFLSRRWQGTFAIKGARHTVLATSFVQTREALGATQPGAGDFASSSRTRQTGGNLVWTLRITPRTNSTLNVGATRNQFPELGREDKNRFLRAALAHQLLPRVSASLNYRLLRTDSSAAGASFREQALSAALVARF